MIRLKILLSSVPYKNLKVGLLDCRDVKEVFRFIMHLDYFCYVSVTGKKQLSSVQSEMQIYASLSSQPLYISALHNSMFYEEEGTSKLNYWSYFRNIKEIQSGTPPPPLLTQAKIDETIKKIAENNFSEHEFFTTVFRP